MVKKITQILTLVFICLAANAQTPSFERIYKRLATKEAQQPQRTLKSTRSAATPLEFDFSDVKETILIEEDFSKFTEGTEEAPDTKQLGDENGVISEEYFNTPGWGGYDVFQAGGVCYIGFSQELQSTGMLISPTIDLSNGIVIRLKARSSNPAGDYFNYNIFDAQTQDNIDANYHYIGNEWTEIELLTTYGSNQAYLFFFSEESEMFIDDIRISRISIDTPILLEETNLRDKGFTAAWEAVDGADEYNVFAFAEHAVGKDSLCVWADFDFANMKQGGTENEPIIDEENESVSLDDICKNDFAGWSIIFPAYADGMVGLSGAYAAYGWNGLFSSPEMDLSANNGTVTISLDVKAQTEDVLAVAILALGESGYEYVDYKYLSASENWSSHEVTLQNGNKNSCIEIISGSYDVIFIDNVRVTQKFSPGTIVNHNFLGLTTAETTAEVGIPERYRGDKISYAVRATKTFETQTEEGGLIKDVIASEFTEKRYVELPTGISTVIQRKANSASYDLQGRRLDYEKLPKGALYIQGGKVRIK